MVWHAAAAFPRQVGARDGSGRTPLGLACAGLASLHAERVAAGRLMEAASSAEADEHKGAEVDEMAKMVGLVVENEEGDDDDDDDDPRSRAARRLVESILFGDEAVSVQDLLLASAAKRRTAGDDCGVLDDRNDKGGNDSDGSCSTGCDDPAKRRTAGVARNGEKEASRFRSDTDACTQQSTFFASEKSQT